MGDIFFHLWPGFFFFFFARVKARIPAFDWLRSGLGVAFKIPVFQSKNCAFGPLAPRLPLPPPHRTSVSWFSWLRWRANRSLFWVAVSQLTAGAEQINWSPSALPVQEHATMSIYSKRQISDLFYLYSCYAFSSFSSPPPPLCCEIPRTRRGFCKSHGAVWPFGINQFWALCSHRCRFHRKVSSFLV